jgi:hypothetical protein
MTSNDDLPIKDYDHLQVGGLTSRIRSLGAEELQTLIGYERSHANRFQVVTIMQNRLSSLKEGAKPSGGDPAATGAADSASAAGGSKVSEATTGPKINPPSHGDPTNPAQPRPQGGSGPRV